MVLLKQHRKGGNNVTNVKLLEEKIRQSGLKKGYVAERIGVSRGTLCSLLSNKTEFKISQIRALCEVLDIKDDETIKAIFFAPVGA
jgi:transcriptional regulator with XRE-family HTH domain